MSSVPNDQNLATSFFTVKVEFAKGEQKSSDKDKSVTSSTATTVET